MDIAYIFLSEEEVLEQTLSKKQTLLREAYKKVLSGEDAFEVAEWTLNHREITITATDLNILAKAVSQMAPKPNRNRLIDKLKKRGR